jgi:hypothetical protein
VTGSVLPGQPDNVLIQLSGHPGDRAYQNTRRKRKQTRKRITETAASVRASTGKGRKDLCLPATKINPPASALKNNCEPKKANSSGPFRLYSVAEEIFPLAIMEKLRDNPQVEHSSP